MRPNLDDEILVKFPKLDRYMKLSGAVAVETYCCLHENDKEIPAEWRWVMNKVLHALDDQLQPLRNEQGFYNRKSEGKG